jgi:hypothetical protein
MLGYAEVRMNYGPGIQPPMRTLLPGEKIPDNPDNRGATGYGGWTPKADITTNTPISGDHGDSDLTQENFTTGVPTGKNYKQPLAGAIMLAGQNNLISEAYGSALAQAQKLRNNQHFNLQGLTRRIVSPDPQTQFEQGYTLPLQSFAFISSKLWNTPAGRNVAGSTMTHKQPSLKRPAPTSSIPTRMPWNGISAPGSY